MGILEVFELIPLLRELERLKISELSVEPLHIPIDRARRVQILGLTFTKASDSAV